MNKISILLSTYNGEKYLAVQLDSIMNQTCQDFTLYIRDDGSKDNTVNIIKGYSKRHPKHIIFIEDNKGNLGVEKSFRELMTVSKSDYYFFCDQDDIWNKTKIETMVKFANNDIPYLAYSDLNILKDNKIAPKTFISNTKIKKTNIQKGVLKGFIPGCSMMFNEKIKKMYLQHRSYLLHDGFVLFLASNYGKVHEIKKPLMQYRLHNSNTIGMKKDINYKILLFDLIKYFFRKKKYRKIILENYFNQVENIKNINTLKMQNCEILDESQVNNLSWLKRKKWFISHFLPIKSSNFISGIIQIILI